MARSDVLVSADWAESNLDAPSTVFVEIDEDTSAYDVGHIPGAVKLDWKNDLQDRVKRDFVDAQQFSKLLSERGVADDDTVILYGGNHKLVRRLHLLVRQAVRPPDRQTAQLRPQEMGTRRPRSQLYADAGLDGEKETIAYCRIGEHSSHTWFVLQELLGHANVKNYDGSWTEYGCLVGAPIELGS